MHQHHVDIVEIQLLEHFWNNFHCRIVSKVRRENFGGDKDFFSRNAARNSFMYALANCLMIQVEIRPIDHSATQKKEPQNRTFHHYIVISSRATTHPQAKGGHRISDVRVTGAKLDEGFIGGAGLWCHGIWDGRGTHHPSMSYQKRWKVAFQ